MNKIGLSGQWKMTGNGYEVTGNIPGSVYSFLIDKNLVPDPFYRDNEFLFLELAEHPYTFERSFTYTKRGVPVRLVCEGLDTVCTVQVNGKIVGECINMHVRHSFDVTSALVDGENKIRIDFTPPNPYIKEKYEKHPIPACWDALKGYMHIRKAHCMLGWDWGPRLPDMGIWRDIYLLEIDSDEITSFTVDQHHENGRVFITPTVTTARGSEAEVTLKAPDGKCVKIKANCKTEISCPELWWPNNLGDQPLYTLTAEIKEGGKTVDKKTKRIGLRTLKLIREKDKWGESFCHEINGVRFFAMGADYIPEDNILSRISKERTYDLIKQCKISNFNTIRVWGGGYYPDDYFFDACDELGIIVFFDLMFACAPYDPDERMWESIKIEVRQNLTRIRDHASLALISGNNEVEEMIAVNPDWQPYREPYVKMFEEAFRDIVKEVAPHLDYVASSPSTCGHFVDPRNDDFGDQHYWEIWHGAFPIEHYRNKYCRYLSEFGFQGICDYKTIKQFTREEDRNLNSKIMELHERSANGYAKILSHLQQYFLYPTSFKALVYASQVIQAEAIRTAVEHFRRNRGRCMGTLYWQLNDIWPVTSWASIDYYGRWKAVQYLAKRFYKPITVTCEETGFLQTARFMIAEPKFYDWATKARLCVHNETKKEITATVKWSLADNESKVIKRGEKTLTVPALSVKFLDELDFEKTDFEKNHLSFELILGGEVISSESAIFAQHKYYEFKDPALKVRREGDEIVVKADAYARYVEIYSEEEDFLLSDNFFDMEKGEIRVKILRGDPKNLLVRSVYDIR